MLRELERRGIDQTSDAYRTQIELIEEIAVKAQKREDRLQLQADIQDTSRAAAELVGQFARDQDVKSFFKNLIGHINDLAIEIGIVRPLMKEFESFFTGQAKTGGANQNMFGLLAGSAVGGGMSGGAGTFGQWLGDLFGAGGLAAGTDYVPKTGLRLIHEGERIIPAAENRRRSGGGGTNNISINLQGQVQPGTARQIGASVARELAIANRRLN
jgi:hypothetical protein